MSLTRLEQKKLLSLAVRKGRRREGMFLAEGVRLLEEALKWGKVPLEVFYHQGVSERGKKLLTAFEKEGAKGTELTESQLTKITSTVHSQGIAALFELPDCSLPAIFQQSFKRILWCHSLADPGNIGTLLRSALAFGFDMLILSGDSADPFSPKVVRSSMGAIFALPIAISPQKEVAELITREQPYLIAADSSGVHEVNAIKVEKPDTNVILAIGSESTGLPREIIDTSNLVLRIRQEKEVESLNAAVAGSILMREIYEQL